MAAYTKHTYETVAGVFQRNTALSMPHRLNLIEQFVDVFNKDNPRFLVANFVRACIPDNMQGDPRVVTLITKLLLSKG